MPINLDLLNNVVGIKLDSTIKQINNAEEQTIPIKKVGESSFGKYLMVVVIADSLASHGIRPRISIQSI